MGFPPLLNLSTRLSTAALPGQTTKAALTLEFMFQNMAYRPTVYITGHVTTPFAKKDVKRAFFAEIYYLIALERLLIYLHPIFSH